MKIDQLMLHLAHCNPSDLTRKLNDDEKHLHTEHGEWFTKGDVA